jgi:hypothetical protein
MTEIDFATIDQLTGGEIGTIDVPCPLCGPSRRAASNRVRKVLRIWRLDRGFASFCCQRCGTSGYARDGTAPRLSRAKIERTRAELEARDRARAAQRRRRAQWMWRSRRPAIGSIVERYLREARGYTGPIPAILGYLPARGDYAPAMVTAFGFASEPNPGIAAIAPDDVVGVHITKLAPDGSGKAGTDQDKIIIGPSLGAPIVLAPINDLLGVAIVEGIEDGLSVYAATGLGVWAAGSAPHMPALAKVIPAYVEAVTVYAHDDLHGQDFARALAAALHLRGVEVFVEGLRS